MAIRMSTMSARLKAAAHQQVKERNYWWKKLAGNPVKVHFPYDHTRESENHVHTPGQVKMKFRLEGESAACLGELSKKSGIRYHMIMVTGVVALLYKYTGNNDITVGMPIYRQVDEGEYINKILPLRHRVDDQITFRGLLNEARQTIVGASENQDYPMEVLIEDLEMASSSEGGDFPLFDVAILLEDLHEKEYLSPISLEMVFSFNGQGKTIEGDLEYNPHRYGEATVRRIVAHLERLLQAALGNPDQKLAKVEILSEEEKKQLEQDFNDTAAPFPGDSRIDKLFEEQARKTPHQTAVDGLSEITVTRTMTYEELDKKSGRLAGELRERGVTPGAVLGLLVERSLEMIIGLLGILKAGAAYLPIDPGYPGERIDYMLKDSGSKIVVSDKKNVGTGQCPVLILDLFHADNGKSEARQNDSMGAGQCPVPTAASLAYVIYTSGSTGKPRGVMVEHRNVVRLVKNSNFIRIDTGDRLLLTGVIVFDIATFEIWGPLLNGATLFLVPQDLVLEGEKIGKILGERNITILHLIPQLFNRLARLHPGIFAGLKYLMVGGDLVIPRYVNQIRRQYPALRILHMYGPTENTTFSTFFPLEKEYENAISIGKPISNSTVYIFDKHDRLLPIGVPGELVVGGCGVARGYLNNPELTAEKFIVPSATRGFFRETLYRHPAPRGLDPHKSFPLNPTMPQKVPGKNHDTPTAQIDSAEGVYSPEGRLLLRAKSQEPRAILYKTGDLARWLEDGNIEFLGRIDNQVKIRGIRIELTEIESRLHEHRKVKEAVVVARPIDTGKKDDGTGEKYLCAYIVPHSPGEADELSMEVELKAFLSQRIPGYMVPTHIIPLEKIPVTHNGKVDRNALPDPGIKTAAIFIAPGNRVEKKLVEIWSEVLGIPGISLGIADNFFHLGGHSLSAATIAAKIHKEMNVKLNMTDVFKAQTVRGLSEMIGRMTTDRYRSIRAVEKKEYYPLTPAQKRLYIIRQLDQKSTAYNMPLVLEADGELDEKNIEETFRRLIHRHESFRTSFEKGSETAAPVQRIHPGVEFYIRRYRLRLAAEKKPGAKERDLTPGEVIDHFLQPFDLSEAPLLRVGLLRLEKNKSLIMIDLHHIISDGSSHRILTGDFWAIYRGEKLPGLKLQYKDYAEWQRKTAKELLKKQEAYWLEQYRSTPGELNLPTDFARPEVQAFAGSYERFSINTGENQALKRIALEAEATLFMVLLALYDIFLAKISGKDDIVTGIPVSGHHHPDMEKVIGMFVNTLPIRNFPTPAKQFKRFLEEVKENVLEAFENQDYPFEDLVNAVVKTRNPSRNPLFDVSFNFVNFNAPAPAADVLKKEGPQLNLQAYNHPFNIAKFDLELQVVEEGDRLSLAMIYSTKLYKKEKIRSFIKYFEDIVSSVIDDPGKNISGIAGEKGKETGMLLARFIENLEEE